MEHLSIIPSGLSAKKALECDTERLYSASPDYDNKEGDEGRKENDIAALTPAFGFGASK